MTSVLIGARSGFRRRLFEAVLRPEYDELTTAQSGVEIVDQATQDCYDVIVIEESLPIKTGIETAGAVQDTDTHAGIVLTLERQQATVCRDARAAGVDEIVVLPFDAQGLRTACQTAASTA